MDFLRIQQKIIMKGKFLERSKSSSLTWTLRLNQNCTLPNRSKRNYRELPYEENIVDKIVEKGSNFNTTPRKHTWLQLQKCQTERNLKTNQNEHNWRNHPLLEGQAPKTTNIMHLLTPQEQTKQNRFHLHRSPMEGQYYQTAIGFVSRDHHVTSLGYKTIIKAVIDLSNKWIVREKLSPIER